MLGAFVRIGEDGLGLCLRIVAAHRQLFRMQFMSALPHAFGIGLFGHSSTVPGEAFLGPVRPDRMPA